MSIAVTCSCGKKLQVKDELAGKRGKCPACGALLTIPQPPSSPPLAQLAPPLQSPPPRATPAATSLAPPKNAPFLCPRCSAVLQKTLNAKNLLTQLALGLSLGFYFVPTSPFRCPRCGPIRYHELSKEESYRAQEVISAKGCFKLGCAVVLGSFVLIFVVGYILNLLGIKVK
jgi:predicted RNA-binding Zn-ribbon protein involved in translation (DUF1610 family)